MTIGFLVCSYNDLDLSLKMYPSLISSVMDDFATKFGYGLVCVDAGSTDGSVEFWQGTCLTIHKGNEELCRSLGVKGEDLTHLSVSLNAGIRSLLMAGCDKIVHIHPDMVFENNGWAGELAKFIDDNPWAGKVATDDFAQEKKTRFPANQCAWMMSKAVIEKHIEKDGYVFDEKYIKCGGVEDHDLCRRQLLMGYVPAICGSAVIHHPSMLTRQRHDNLRAGYDNCHYYINKWKTPDVGNWSYGIENFWDKLDWKYDK